MKDLFKPGRPLNEYLDEKGKLKINCLTCIHRRKMSEGIAGDFLCSGGSKKHKECHPDHNMENNWKLNCLLWEPRVNINVFLTKEDFENV